MHVLPQESSSQWMKYLPTLAMAPVLVLMLVLVLLGGMEEEVAQVVVGAVEPP